MIMAGKNRVPKTPFVGRKLELKVLLAERKKIDERIKDIRSQLNEEEFAIMLSKMRRPATVKKNGKR